MEAKVTIRKRIFFLQVLKQDPFLKTIIAFFAIVFLFLSTGCEKNGSILKEKKSAICEIDSSERVWMGKFFQEVMLDESAIYTLWGSKPLTIVVLDHITEEEVNSWLQKLTEEEKKEVIFSSVEYDLSENWQKWEKIQSRFPITKYLFFKRARSNDTRFEDIYFVNILQTAFVLQDHYDLFKRLTGEDFEPLTKVFEIKNENSDFWAKVFNSQVMSGIVFGFGVKNASSFQWKYELVTSENPSLETFLSKFHPHFEENKRLVRPSSISDFSLPAFASFSQEQQDEIQEKYKKERETIKAIYKGKDFLRTTLEKLSS